MSYDDDYVYQIQAMATAEAAAQAAILQQQQLEQFQALQATQEYATAQAFADIAANAYDVTQIRRDLHIDDVRQVLQDTWNQDTYVPPPEPPVYTYDNDPSLIYHLDPDRPRWIDDATAHDLYYHQMVADADRRAQEASGAAFDVGRIESFANDSAARFLADQGDHLSNGTQQFVDDFVRAQAEAAEAALQSAIADAAAQLELARQQAELAYTDEMSRAQLFADDTFQRTYADQLALDLAQAEAQRNRFDLDYRHQAEIQVAEYTAQLTQDAERIAREYAEAYQAELTAQLLQEADTQAHHEATKWLDDRQASIDDAVRAHQEQSAAAYLEEIQRTAHDDYLRSQMDHAREEADRAFAEQMQQARRYAEEEATRQARQLEDDLLRHAEEERQRVRDDALAHLDVISGNDAHRQEENRQRIEEEYQSTLAAAERDAHERALQEQHRLTNELYERQRQDSEQARQTQLHQAEAQALEQAAGVIRELMNQHQAEAERHGHERADAYRLELGHTESEAARHRETQLAQQLRTEAEAHVQEHGAQRYAQHLEDEMLHVIERTDGFRQGKFIDVQRFVEAEFERLRLMAEAHTTETAELARAQALQSVEAHALTTADKIRDEAQAIFKAAEIQAAKHSRGQIELASTAAADAVGLVKKRVLENAEVLADQLRHPDFDSMREVLHVAMTQARTKFLSKIDDRIAEIAARLRGESDVTPVQDVDPMDVICSVAAKLAGAEEPQPLESINAGQLAFAKNNTKSVNQIVRQRGVYLSPWDDQSYQILSERTQRRAANSGDRASITESEEYNRQLRAGYVGLQRPGRVNAGGPDSITFDPEAGCIVVNDTKYRGPESPFPPVQKGLTAVLNDWSMVIERAVLDCKTGNDAIDDAVKTAWEARKVEVRRQNRRGPGLPENASSDLDAF
ncbi:MAG TPA: hypothetical protein VHB01_06850 [Nitrosospira sp.]|nr:hypothetical protein [Nitrosospira sp.]